MLLLNGTLCSKDFRMIGTIHSCINIFVQVVILGVLTMVVNYYVKHGRGGYTAPATKITLVALAFVILEIVIYISLIYGLVKRKPCLLLVWLCFAPSEFIIVQLALLWFVYIIIKFTIFQMGILALVVYILATLYLVHNVCVIFSARQGFIQDQESSDSSLGPPNANTPAPMAPYLQCPQQNSAPIQQMPGVWGYGFNLPQYLQTQPQPVVNQFHYNTGIAETHKSV